MKQPKDDYKFEFDKETMKGHDNYIRQQTAEEIFKYLKETDFKQVTSLCEYCNGEFKQKGKEMCDYHFWIKNYLDYVEKEYLKGDEE